MRIIRQTNHFKSILRVGHWNKINHRIKIQLFLTKINNQFLTLFDCFNVFIMWHVFGCVGSKLDISIQVLLPLHRPWASIFHFIYSNMSLVSPSKLRQWPTSENAEKIRSKIELFSTRIMNAFFVHFLHSWKPHANVLEFFNKSAQVIHFISCLWSSDTLLIIKTKPESVSHTLQN